MKYDYQRIITFALNEPFDINYIMQKRREYPNDRFLIEVQNTKGITSSMISQLDSNMAFRIAGGYDRDRINRFGKDIHWSSNYYFEASTYSRNETIHIIDEMQRIESGINKNWSDIQKLLYIYDKLKREIMYDPKHEEKSSNEIRSLRGFLTGNTVCAGYAMMFKELMDRNNIRCEYVEGYSGKTANGTYTGGHAWNIVEIEGKKYPIDLTWDNTRFRSGKRNAVDWLGKDVSEFARKHYPLPGEKTQNYTSTLSQIDPQVIKTIENQMGLGRATDYKTTTYWSERDDGSRFVFAQLGYDYVENKRLFRYYFAELLPNGKTKKPLILFSETNVTHLIDCKKFGRPIPPGYEHAIDSYLFSRENIADSLNKGTCYIGGVDKSKDVNKVDVINSPKEIQKDENISKALSYKTTSITRSDGSVIAVQKMSDRPFVANGVAVYRFDLFEMVKENNREVLKRNTVYSEVDFTEDKRRGIGDDYLSRDRIDRKVQEAGGYIGYYRENGTEYGIRTYDPNLNEYFSTSKKVELSNVEQQKKSGSPVIRIPEFEEVKALVEKYTIDINLETPGSFKVIEVATGNLVTDPVLCDRALFANIWLSAAGVKIWGGDKVPGERYAFNSQANGLYNYICNELANACRSKGVIDTVDILRNARDHIPYKYDDEIIIRMFRTPFQVELINKLFCLSQGINKRTGTPEPLYSMSHAGQLLHENADMPKTL